MRLEQIGRRSSYRQNLSFCEPTNRFRHGPNAMLLPRNAVNHPYVFLDTFGQPASFITPNSKRFRAKSASATRSVALHPAHAHLLRVSASSIPVVISPPTIELR